MVVLLGGLLVAGLVMLLMDGLMMKPKTKLAITNMVMGLVVVAFIVAAVCWEIDLWNECRTTNSFFYCMRVLGK